MGGTWAYLDITALGRQEDWEGLAGGLPAGPTVRVVELPRRLRQRSLIAGVGFLPPHNALPALAVAGLSVMIHPRTRLGSWR
jgi:hypothetical protein